MNARHKEKINADEVKVYIRHCGERTVPVLQWYFADFDVELIDGNGKAFADLLEVNYQKILNQNQPYALVADGDLVPILSVDTVLQVMITPMMTNQTVTAVNGTRTDKFLSYNGPISGGLKGYKKKTITDFLHKLDKSHPRPEGFLFVNAGSFHQVKSKMPQVGHEYGQFLWHLYEKGHRKGRKYLKGVKLRKRQILDLDFAAYKDGFMKGLHSAEKQYNCPYNLNSVPDSYKKKEKHTIATNINDEYQALRHEIMQDAKVDSFSKIRWLSDSFQKHVLRRE